MLQSVKLSEKDMGAYCTVVLQLFYRFEKLSK